MNQSERNKKRLVAPTRRKVLKNCADGSHWRGRSCDGSVARLSIQTQLLIKISMDCTSHPAGPLPLERGASVVFGDQIFGRNSAITRTKSLVEELTSTNSRCPNR